MEVLRENHDLDALRQLMAEQGREQQTGELDRLLRQMDSMERQLRAVSQELQAVRAQLTQASGLAAPEQRLMAGLIQKLDSRIQSLRERLAGLRDHMASWAKDTLEHFKQSGVSALDSAFSSLKVKEGLQQVQVGVQGCTDALRGGIRRVERMGSELRQAGKHLHDAGRAAVGKEPAQQMDTTQEGRFQAGLLLPLRTAAKGLSHVNNAALAAIGSVERLEQAARKPSIRQALAEKKAEAAAHTAPEPAQTRKHQEAAL